jgi:tol-pal system protein YbgF
MKRFWIAPILAALVLLHTVDALAQYPSSNNRTVMGRLDQLERNIMLLQKQSATGQLPEGVEPSEAAAGSLQSQIAELQETISKLRGEIEQAQYQNRQLKEQYDRSMKDMDFRLQDMEKKMAAAPVAAPIADVPPQENVPPESIDTSSEYAPETESVETPEPALPVKPEPKPVNKPEATNVPPAKEFGTPREHYNYAFRQLNAAKYPEASSSFQSFVKLHPKDPLAGNAFYWLGETFYVRRDYVKAADSFRQGFEALPSGPKAPDNLLKLSMSLNALKRDKEACVVLKQLVSKFGKNSETTKKKAQAEIVRIGCQ